MPSIKPRTSLAQTIRAKVATENDLQLSAGGDGTLNLVINGMLRKASDAPCAVGLIPFGIGNDFAGACGIPSGRFLEALDIVLGTSPVHIDVGQVNETFFVNVVAGGFPA